MEPQNDSTTVSTETTEEKGAETTEKEKSSNDLSEVMAKLEEFGNDIASLKRTAKKVTKTEKSDTPKKTDQDSSFSEEQVESLFFQVNQITKDSEKKLVRDLQSETGMTLPKLLESKYFKTELEELRTKEANVEATSDIKGDKSGGGGKQSAQYWIAKGEYPSREQVPDRAVRGEIRKALAQKESGSTGGFYNS